MAHSLHEEYQFSILLSRNIAYIIFSAIHLLLVLGLKEIKTTLY